MKNFAFTIGCDPEFFLTQEGKYKSAVGKVPGTKHEPFPLDLLGNNIQVDNVCVEFNTSPANDPESFSNNIDKVVAYLRKKLPDYEFSRESMAKFYKTELRTKEAQTFGCEPDYNAWTGSKNPSPSCSDPTLRSAGGHIHIGCDLAINDPIELIRACDVFLGVPSTKIDFTGKKRRMLYGQAGSYRLKPFGVEYRTLSNFWIFEKSLHEWVYTQTQKALNFIGNGGTVMVEDAQYIQEIINNDNISLIPYIKERYQV